VTFFIIAPYIHALLLIEEFLVGNIYGSSINNTYKLKFLLEGLKCYKDTYMKAYDITKLIAELTSDNVQYRKKCITLLHVLVS